MNNILHIDSSLFGKNGASSLLATELVEKLKSQSSAAQVTYRNVTEDELPHFSASTMADLGKGEATLADQLIEEVQAADVIIIGAPMYNFSVPSQLKSWFDHIARAGVTFQYTSQGPEGLLKNKKVFVITSRGGIHKDRPTDVMVPYLNTILGFVGLTDVDYIYAEGLSMSDHKEQAMQQAGADLNHAFEQFINREEVTA